MYKIKSKLYYMQLDILLHFMKYSKLVFTVLFIVSAVANVALRSALGEI